MRMQLYVRLKLSILDDGGRDVWARFASEHYGTPAWKDIEAALWAGADDGGGTDDWSWDLEDGVLILEHTYEPGVMARYPLDVIRADLREFADAAARRPM
jgi:hypothetical protein